MSDLHELSRADLVQAAKAAGVRASGKSEDIIAAIEAAKGAAPVPASVDGEEAAPEDAAQAAVIAVTADPADPEALSEAATADRPTLPDPAPTVTSGEELPIRRVNDHAWWCPLCDHSQTHTYKQCDGCGAVRDGETVSAP